MRASLAVLILREDTQHLKQSANEFIMCTTSDLDFWRRHRDGGASY